MENTGRIKQAVAYPASRILFGGTTPAEVEFELRHISRVDRAHLVMLAECGIISKEQAARLLELILLLDADDFAPLHVASAPRGIYLAYEDFLISKVGPETGGVLHTARSRNDLNATVLCLRLRGPYLALLRESLRLQAVLIRRARRYADVVMPAYTHYQAAVPITYGHYLAGIGCALSRDIEGLFAGAQGLDHCPLGAGAAGGTSFPIDPARTAALLGFDHPVTHSIDAVAARDLVLRLLSGVTVLGITLSRLAADLLLWTTAEFGFLTLPDRLVGSSSMMPQKRNVYLLEHVQGRSAAALGAFVSAATAMHAKPYTNSISVGTEAVSHVWGALQSLIEALTLARLIVAGACPQPTAMNERAEAGYTTATELANRLVAEGGMPFRSAHHIVGRAVSEAVLSNTTSLTDALARLQTNGGSLHHPTELKPRNVVDASIYGGGPGRSSLDACLKAMYNEWHHHAQRKREQARKWATASSNLDEVVLRLCRSITESRISEPALQ
ncbi:MAG: argininosuccinate lyase [Acidobacteriota bacterium]|nr:argininosuccinate lyase [Acidobacteriota bacterium]